MLHAVVAMGGLIFGCAAGPTENGTEPVILDARHQNAEIGTTGK